MSFCLMKSQMMRVISSPSISTMGFSTLILDMVGAPGLGWIWWGYIRGRAVREGLKAVNGLRRRRDEPRSARPRVGAPTSVVVTLSRKILQRLCGLGRCNSARPGGGRALRGGAFGTLIPRVGAKS